MIGSAILVARIATGEVEDTKRDKSQHSVALGQSGGAKGGKARAAEMSKAERIRAAKYAAKSHWSNKGSGSKAGNRKTRNWERAN